MYKDFQADTCFVIDKNLEKIVWLGVNLTKVFYALRNICHRYPDTIDAFV